MSLTSEQTARIKSSVKTKLVDIGAYVDDQLSDYVMIMITNKKNEKQMTEDLELFLGGLEQAQNFSAWLHTLIKRTIDGSEKVPTKTSTSTSSSHHHHHHSSSSGSHRKSSTSSKSKNGQNTSQNNEPDELAIQIDSNEFNDDFHDAESKQKRQSSKSSEQPAAIESSKSSGKREEQTTPVDSSASLAKVVQEPAAAVVNRFTKLVEESSRPPVSSVVSVVSRVSSTIGAVIKHEQSEDENEYNRKRVSSTVKVSDRKYNVPRSMQPNKSILFKAVDAANSSCKSITSVGGGKSSKSVADERLDEIRSRRTTERYGESGRGEVFSSHYQKERHHSGIFKKERPEEEERVKRFKKFEITFDQNEEPEIGYDSRRVLTESDESKSDSRLIIRNNSDLLFSDKRNVMKIETPPIDALETESESMMAQDEETEEVQKLSTSTDSESSNNNISINLNKEPKFFVTLTGLEDNEFIKNLNGNKSAAAMQKRTLSDMNDDFDNELDYDEDIEVEEGDEKMMGEYDENGENIDIDEAGDDEQLQKKKLIRCSFWPMCDKGDQCQFLHPNKPCTLFPNCTYGNLCHFLHPSCRYDGYCTRLDCTFTHVIKKPGQLDGQHANKPTGDAAMGEKTENGGLVATNSHKIIINKINIGDQSSVVNKSDMSLVNNIAAVVDPNSNNLMTSSKFSLNNTMSINNSQIRMPRAAAPSPYFKTSPYQFGASNPYSFAHQYSFVNRSSSTPININCKYGKMCQNPKCIYVHPNLPQQSQMKWTANLEASATQAHTETAKTQMDDEATNEIPNIQEAATVTNSMISQST